MNEHYTWLGRQVVIQTFEDFIEFNVEDIRQLLDVSDDCIGVCVEDTNTLFDGTKAVRLNGMEKAARVKELAEYFAGIGSRLDIIEDALNLADSGNSARVVEVGCGDGRDAGDIVPRVKWYEGFDPSIGLIELARKRMPGARFVVAGALDYKYPRELDVIFGFASYLHLDRNDFQAACERAAKALRVGGLLVMTLKERDRYEEEWVEDEFGKRMFYYFDGATVQDLAGTGFEVVRLEHQTLKRKTARWLLVVLRKKASQSLK